MKSRYPTEDSYLLRLERGEDVIESLIEFARKNHIKGAMFHGLGGASHAAIGIYKLSEDREYHFTDFDGDLEIISMNGNISWSDDEPVVHCHATISGPDLQAYGGHVKSMTVAGTCEILLDTRTGPLTRSLDEGIGLKLLDLDDE